MSGDIGTRPHGKEVGARGEVVTREAIVGLRGRWWWRLDCRSSLDAAMHREASARAKAARKVARVAPLAAARAAGAALVGAQATGIRLAALPPARLELVHQERRRRRRGERQR